MSLLEIYKAIKVGKSDSLFASVVGSKLNKDAWKKGFNKWDEVWELGGLSLDDGSNAPATTAVRSKNFIAVSPDTAYCLYCGSNQLTVRYYDANKNFISVADKQGIGDVYANNRVRITPSNCHYIRFATWNGYGTAYLNDICISISGEHNGEYVPYNG